MNILVDSLPTSLEVGGRRYKINSDYRACILTMLAFESKKLSQLEKQEIMLFNLYGKRIPKDSDEAAIKAVWFLNGGEDSKEINGPRIYSFDKDKNMIFSAFRQTHGIDLQKTKLHWWEFVALFMDIGADTTFCSIASLRSRVKSGKATKEEKQMARELGDMFDIEEIDDRTVEEREAERAFMELVEAGERARRQNECQTQP